MLNYPNNVNNLSLNIEKGSFALYGFTSKLIFFMHIFLKILFDKLLFLIFLNIYTIYFPLFINSLSYLDYTYKFLLVARSGFYIIKYSYYIDLEG